MAKQIGNSPFLYDDNGAKVIGAQNPDGSTSGVIVPVDTIADIPTDPGTYKVGIQLFVVGDDGIKTEVITTDNLNVSQFGFEDQPPSSGGLLSDYTSNPLYFDPTDTNSTGAGTLSNPFSTVAQLQSYISNRSGNMNGRWLFFKRGTITREEFVITVYGSETMPFFIGAYGEGPKPIITSCQISSGWEVAPEDSRLWRISDAAIQVVLDTTGEADVRNYHQYFNRSSVANLLAAGPGYQCYTGGYTYIYPLHGQNPNNGSIEKTVGTSTDGCFAIKYSNTPNTGNIHINGIQVYGHRCDGISFKTGAPYASIATIKNISVTDCEVGFVGADISGLISTSDGIVVYGLGGASIVTASNVKVTGNVIYNTMNNSVEFSFVDGGASKNVECSWNVSWNINAKNIIELYATCKNLQVHHNVGRGNRYMKYQVGGAVQGSIGVWIAGYSNAPTYDAASNVGIEVSFNYSSWNGRALYIGPSTSVFYNNTLLGGVQGSSPCVEIGAGGASDITLTNNIVVQENYSTWGGTCTVLKSNHAGDVIRGDYNVIGGDNGQTLGTYFRGTQYTAANWANFLAAVQAVTAGALANTALIPSFIQQNGRPLPVSQVRSLGTASPSDLNYDLNGYPLNSKLIGAMDSYRPTIVGNYLHA